MEWLAIMMGVGVAAGLVAYLTQPWWGRQGEGRLVLAGAAAGSGPTPVEQREAILTALRDLDFDYEVGKITEADYGLLRQSLLAEAAAVMTQLNTLEIAAEANLDEQIEAQILAVRRGLHRDQQVKGGLPSAQPGPACVSCGRPAQPGDLYCTGCGTRLNPACPECGTSIQAMDRFCAGCGLELGLAVSG
ncbi:MAG: hypothetical protein BroJett011_13430 [Chloroflexota bacterium]|nr:MAG: hypothetical protein BroJett011_13430 [Chloroflexota bacterium]